MKTEWGKMVAGELYDAADEYLLEQRERARILLLQFNRSVDEQRKLRRYIHQNLFGSVGPDLVIEPPFHCDYGTNIHIGNRVFFNFNCVVLDPAEVHIGDDVLFGPGVQIYTATHPMERDLRQRGLEAARPIGIGSGVWVGGGAIICPGVRIGEGSVIGAGSVVTRDVPAQVFAAGNPCRVIQPLETGTEDGGVRGR
ncbi:MAG: sugar O-acetyltransferase [Xanthomonadaceae bacterium]|jgi:maltose O-acetyltransferase|nr:sugar O-acetyltransferase [Xanthomonadaceae bacterium]